MNDEIDEMLVEVLRRTRFLAFLIWMTILFVVMSLASWNKYVIGLSVIAFLIIRSSAKKEHRRIDELTEKLAHIQDQD